MKLYSTLTRQKEEFTPLEPGKVKMYACGPTVYDQIHIGNARTFLVFDVIRRYLMHQGYQVTFAQNITDVDDKIINKALAEQRSAADVARDYTQAFIEQMRRFNVMEPDIRPYATQEIAAMHEMISRLIEKDVAYEVDGDVYFRVRAAGEYGQISGRKIDDLIVGARVEENVAKEDPLDFTLWKAAKPGEPSWESPWGLGRPGWHTECAAMVHRYLGTPIDIHGGGSDLQFPHHENEAAQAACCWEKPLANYWMHSGMLLINGEKMSKSLGNFYTLKEVLDRYDASALRLLMLQTHYRSTLDFSFVRLEGALSALQRIKTCVTNLRWAASLVVGESEDVTIPANYPNLTIRCRRTREDFEREMNDDFNTAGAIASLFNLATEANRALSLNIVTPAQADEALLTAQTLIDLFGILGIVVDEEAERQSKEAEEGLIALAQRLTFFRGSNAQDAERSLLELRAEARAQKNWSIADEIRDELAKLGLKIEDTPQGTRVVSAHA